MIGARYILTTAAIYVATFAAMPLFLSLWPPYPAYEAALIMVVGALIFAWAGTRRIQQIVGADETEFAAASVFHALLIAVLLGGVCYIRFRTMS